MEVKKGPKHETTEAWSLMSKFKHANDVRHNNIANITVITREKEFERKHTDNRDKFLEFFAFDRRPPFCPVCI